MDKIIKVQVKSVYGKDLIYPLNNQEDLKVLTKQKTLTPLQVQALRSLGLQVEIEQVKI